MDGEVSRKKGSSRLSKGRGVCYKKRKDLMDMNGREKETLGAYLRREREVRRVEKELMFKEAKIAFPLLTALEEDNWDAFPSRKEIPAYLKRYCRFSFSMKRRSSGAMRCNLPKGCRRLRIRRRLLPMTQRRGRRRSPTFCRRRTSGGKNHPCLPAVHLHLHGPSSWQW